MAIFVSYARKTQTDIEQRYTQTKCEALALVWVVDVSTCTYKGNNLYW